MSISKYYRVSTDITRLMEMMLPTSTDAGAYNSVDSEVGAYPESSQTQVVTEDDIRAPCLTNGGAELQPLLPTRFAGGKTINFRWRWIGELPSDCSFQILMWPQDESPAVIFVPDLADPLAQINRLPDSSYQIALDAPPNMEHLRHYQWSVDLVQIQPEYQVVTSAPKPIAFTWYK